MNQRHQQLKRRVMRRVYTTYALRLATHPLTLEGLLLLVVVAVMAHFVSFSSVATNLMGVEIGRLPSYFMSALYSTEVWTVLLLAVALTLSYACISNLRYILHSTYSRRVLG